MTGGREARRVVVPFGADVARDCASCGTHLPHSTDRLCLDCRDYVVIADGTAIVAAALGRLRARGRTPLHAREIELRIRGRR